MPVKPINKKKVLKAEDEEGLGTVPLIKNKPSGKMTVPLKKESTPEEKFKARKSAKDVGKNPTRKTPKQVMGDEDEESVSKKLKKDGKAVFDGPKVKDRKKFAPATKVEKDKTKYDRKEDKKKLDENTDIINFIECIISKNYASANKYLDSAVDSKILKRIESEIETPLFQ